MSKTVGAHYANLQVKNPVSGCDLYRQSFSWPLLVCCNARGMLFSYSSSICVAYIHISEEKTW